MGLLEMVVGEERHGEEGAREGKGAGQVASSGKGGERKWNGSLYTVLWFWQIERDTVIWLYLDLMCS